jgi:hypothetical protein
VRVHHVLDVRPPVQVLVRLEVRVLVGLADLVAVVRLGEEPGRAQHDHGQPVIAVYELTQVLRSRLGDAVDVAGHRHHVLGDPGRRPAFARGQCPAERAGRAGEHEAADAGRHGLLQEVQRARDVGVKEVLAVVRPDVRLVQCRRVQHRGDPIEGRAHHVPVRDRADHRRVRRVDDVEPDDGTPLVRQHSYQCLTEMPGASGDKNPFHDASHYVGAQPVLSLRKWQK